MEKPKKPRKEKTKKVVVSDRKKATRVNTTIITDSESGEIMQTEQVSTYLLPKEPEFVKLYVKDIGKMFDLTNSDDKVLLCITKYMAYNNMVCLIKPIKECMMQELKMPLNTLNDSIRNLSDSGIIVRKSIGVYQVNPNLFAKGKWEDIVKIRMEIEYSGEGKRITNIVVENRNIELTEAIDVTKEDDKKLEEDDRQMNLFDAIAQAEQKQ